MVEYWAKKNQQSVDGLPGMKHKRMEECEYRDLPPPIMGSRRLTEGSAGKGGGGSSALGWIAGLSQNQLLLTMGAVAVAAFGAGVAASSSRLFQI